MNSLVVDSVELSYGGRSILSNIHLKCEPGDIVGILGRNGCGKSSLLKIMFGSLKGTHQSVRYNGNYTDQLFKIKNAVRFIPQDGLFMDYLTFADLIRIFELEKNLNRLMVLEELRSNQYSKIGSLSGGIRKMVELLTLLYADASYVLMDEPFSYLSPVLVEKLIPHIQYQSKKKGIILTDHQYQTVWSVTNKRCVLYAGNLKEVKETSELEQYGYISLK
ncbi:MAG: ATP-binding cassette domain-containing protein [Bacteroidota bacterium]